MNYNKIPTILPDKYYSKVINKEKIIMFLEQENNVLKIEDYVNHNMLVLKNYPQLKIDDVVEIIEYSNYRINKLKGLDKVSEIFDNVKKEIPNLSNIEIIYTPAHINDKNKQGFRHDATYIKIKDELYEVINTERILSFIGNKEILKDLSESEIIKFLKENSKLLKTNPLDKKEGQITSEQVEEEIKKESDLHIRDALLAHKDDVVKERQKLEEYISKNMPGSIVKYCVNSNEERIYIVGDKLIKFEGKNREMQILDEHEIDNITYGSFENPEGYDKEVLNETYEKIEDFINKEELLEQIITKLYNEKELTQEEINLLTNFLDLYINNLENQVEVPSNLQIIAEKWYENSSIDNEIYKQPEKLQDIYERIRVYRKNRVKMYEPTSADLNNAAFITTFALLESALVLGLIMTLITLFK